MMQDNSDLIEASMMRLFLDKKMQKLTSTTDKVTKQIRYVEE